MIISVKVGDDVAESWREIREKGEEMLSPYAAKSIDSKGRQFEEKKCEIRTEYERDANRILYSMEFRRLRHKTQVFFNVQNDHICTRMEHVLYVSSISTTIARTLNLNQDLTNAIALGHDLGHAPFGHSGERVLNHCLKELHTGHSFQHELHSLRVVDRLASRVSKERINNRHGLNLTYEVRDGISCHCGENISENALTRNSEKDPTWLEKHIPRSQKPYTLEACVVRLVDKIAYVGRDIEDAIRVKILHINDIPLEIRKVLGPTNGSIIDTLVRDIIENSYGRDAVQMSPEKGEALESLIKENYRLIYMSDRIKRYEKNAQNIIEGLFTNLMRNSADPEMLKDNEIKVYNQFYKYIRDIGYGPDEPREQMVADFIAGMTDNYAVKCFDEIFWV